MSDERGLGLASTHYPRVLLSSLIAHRSSLPSLLTLGNTSGKSART